MNDFKIEVNRTCIHVSYELSDLCNFGFVCKITPQVLQDSELLINYIEYGKKEIALAIFEKHGIEIL